MKKVEAIDFDERAYQWKWPNGFVCGKCSHGKGYRLTGRKVVECASCGYQESPISRTVFNSTKMSLNLWKKAMDIYKADPEVSALSLCKQIEVHWRTARSMLRKFKKAKVLQDKAILRLFCLDGDNV